MPDQPAPSPGEYFAIAISQDGAERPVVAGTRIRVTIGAGRISAHAGCNTMVGSYELSGDTLTCGPVAMTMMAGAPDVMAQEQWVAQFLDDQITWHQQGDALVLTAGGRRLELDRDDSAPVSPLVGTMWRVREIRNPAGEVVVTEATLQSVRADVLLTDSVMSVQTGCNLGQARVSVGDAHIEVGPMRLTRRGCPPEAAPVEHALVAVLSGTVHFSLAGDRLELSRPGADAVLLLHAEPAGTNVPPSR